MRRNKALKRDGQYRNRSLRIPVIQVLAAGVLGYLLGSLNTTALRRIEPSAAEAVAARFPEVTNTPENPLSASIAAAATRRTTDAGELALLSPESMVRATNAQASGPAAPPADRQTPAKIATLDIGAMPPAPETAAPVQPKLQPAAPKTVAALPPGVGEPKPVAAAAHRTAVNRTADNRPGYMLNDAQIASIKARLNLTPDQEQMWPAVEVALRNMNYAHGQPVHERNPSETQNAAVDPNAVQGLKSAASPLIMSFNAEQKEEVRNLIHVMGLDQLASEF
jgi:hypothetical protein